MSYRRCTLEFLEFNQDLENGITGGYALGEDADFSMRVAKTGKLVGLASEAVLHKLSPISRASLEQMELARGAWFAYLTRNFPSKFKKRKIFLVLVLNSIAVFLGLRPRSGLTRLSVVTASLRIKGFVNEKKKPNLIAESPR
jgi:GT2 family glycosyltransferase